MQGRGHTPRSQRGNAGRACHCSAHSPTWATVQGAEPPTVLPTPPPPDSRGLSFGLAERNVTLATSQCPGTLEGETGELEGGKELQKA